MIRHSPSRGDCHAVFLLVHSAQLRSCADPKEWIAAARSRTTIVASSYDLVGIARELLDVGLVEHDGSIKVSVGLSRLTKVADTTTLKTIAKLLLRARPPAWLRIAIVDGKLINELVPTNELQALAWLGDDLIPILLAVYHQLFGDSDNAFREGLGLAGELAVMSALSKREIDARHVALISDGFGYDIEIESLAGSEGIEVKCAVPSTSNRFFLSRNEFEVSKRMGSRWHLFQVIFSSNVVASGRACAADVEAVRKLSARDLVALAADDSKTFRWTSSAEFLPPQDMWRQSDLRPDSTFDVSLSQT